MDYKPTKRGSGWHGDSPGHSKAARGYRRGKYFVYGKQWNDENFKKKVITEVGRKPTWGYEKGVDKFGYERVALPEAKRIGGIYRKNNENNGGMVYFGKEKKKNGKLVEEQMQNIENDYIFR